MGSEFSFSDKETGWNNRNKTKKQKALLRERGSVLNQRMSLSLDAKIVLAKRRIQEALSRYGPDACYVSFSGGKDSTVLSHLIWKMGYELDHVLSDTRLEYPECLKFAKEWCDAKNVDLTIVRPDDYPYDLWKKYGYPMFSKEIAELLDRMYLGHHCPPKHLKKVQGFLKRLGYKGDPADTNKVQNYLKRHKIKISAKCCEYLKKRPMHKWQKASGKKVALIGVRAEESQMRRTVWVRKGCIYESKGQLVVHPIVFFTEDDINEYSRRFKIRFADIYYQGIKRNGCFCCGFGCHKNDNNNFIKLKQRNPALYANVMNQWGYAKICEACKVKV